MSIFGRRPEPTTGHRSAEERERARLERERRRAERAGLPVPPAPAPVDEPSWEPVAAEPVHEEPFVSEPAVAEPAYEEPAPAVAKEDPVYEEPLPEPPVAQAPPVEEPPSWFDDGTPVAEPATALDRGQETVEWDALAGRPKEVVTEPEAEPEVIDPADQLNRPTVEWDVLAEQEEHEADHEPTVRRVIPARTPAATGAGAPAAARAGDLRGERPAPPARAVTAARFGDEHERPAPTRRAPRTGSRTLPPPPPPPGERRRGGGNGPGRPRGRSVGVLVVLVLLAGAAAWAANALFQPFAGDGGGEVSVTIGEASTASAIGDQLEEAGVVDSAFFFTLRARLDGGNLKAGDYTLRRDMAYGDAIKALSAGPPPPRTINVTIPEGRARRETAPLVRQAGIRGNYLAASEQADGFNPRRFGAPRDVESLEGFLFPATYELEPGASAGALVRQQLDAFRQNLDKVDMRRARRRNLTPFDVLTIASMVEREASLDRERPLIAAVIHNRLRQGMPLGIDATIRYATRNWSSPLKQSELAIDSPYNTRTRTGLPPGPIGSPGLASMQAAADPADVDHLFYVVKPGTCGEHNFSATDAEFQEDVAEYNRARDAAGGKSPTTC